MKNAFLLLLTVFLLSSSACKKERLGSLELNFKASFLNQPLVLAQNYQLDGKTINIQALRFYISDVRLSQSAQSDPLRQELDVADVNLEKSHINLLGAQQGHSVLIQNVPVAEYEALNFGLGVEPGLNATKPSEYSTSHPLASNYWASWNSYIHARIEGRIDTNNDGNLDLGFSYHLGMDDQYRYKKMTKNFNIIEDETTILYFNLDLHSIIDSLDIINKPITHTDPSVNGSVELSAEIMDEFYQNILIE